MRVLPVVVFVDSDALPHPASSEGHADLLAALAGDRITVIFCSRRTRAQVEGTRQVFGIFHPFICESGSAALVPERYFGSDPQNTRKIGGYHAIEFGTPYGAVSDLLHRTAERLNLGVLAFSDMSVEQVARECELSLLEARLAKLREYREPFRLLRQDPMAERRLFRALESAGMICRAGAPFHEVGSAPGPQAALTVLTTLYRLAFGDVITVAAGEGAAAAELAQHADVRLDPCALDPCEQRAARPWLSWLLERVRCIRDEHAPRRAARAAR